MNARLGFRLEEVSLPGQAKSFGLEASVRQLVYRALLLEASPSAVAQRLGLPADHGRWMSSIYEDLARREAVTLLADWGASPVAGEANVDLIVSQLRQALTRPTQLDEKRVARLLRRLAGQLQVADCRLVPRVVRELDAALALAVQGSSS